MAKVGVAGPAAAKGTRSRINYLGELLGLTVSYALLSAGTIIVFVPFLWMISTSLKEEGQIFLFPPVWIPHPVRWQNYLDVSQQFPFFVAVLNSAKISVLSVFGVLLSSSLAAFAFARLRFRGKNIWFPIFLATLMIPAPVTLIPVFLLMRTIGWVNTLYPLIIPNFFGNAFGMFLLRQFFLTIPRDLDDAAKIDGASPPLIFARIYLPLAKPALATLAVFVFLATWNDLIGPAIYLSSMDKITVTLGLSFLSSQYGGTLWGPLMAGSIISLLPVLIVFIFAQQYFVQGLALSGIKG